MEKIRFQVYRYNPDVDAKPYMQDYELEVEPTDVKLLDALVKLKAQDDSLCRFAAPAAKAFAVQTA